MVAEGGFSPRFIQCKSEGGLRTPAIFLSWTLLTFNMHLDISIHITQKKRLVMIGSTRRLEHGRKSSIQLQRCPKKPGGVWLRQYALNWLVNRKPCASSTRWNSCLESMWTPTQTTTTRTHMEVGFKWMWTHLATPNQIWPVVVDLRAGLQVNLPR